MNFKIISGFLFAIINIFVGDACYSYYYNRYYNRDDDDMFNRDNQKRIATRPDRCFDIINAAIIKGRDPVGRYGYSDITDECYYFEYYGSNGIRNNFPSYDKCMSICAKHYTA